MFSRSCKDTEQYPFGIQNPIKGDITHRQLIAKSREALGCICQVRHEGSSNDIVIVVSVVLLPLVHH